MNRTPPIEVRRQLRKEVGFGCPIPGCGSPYLTWHHFDPPWSEEKHHNPSGMIALCPEHHAKADAGAFTKNQLRYLKQHAYNEEVKGKFDWMRNQLLAVIGSNFFYETPIILEYKNQPRIWFNRDEEGYLLLNVKMLSKSHEPRIIIEDNFWLNIGNPEDLECPPSGKLLKVQYANGDYLKIEFFELETISSAKRRYPVSNPESWGIPFPVTAVEVHKKVGDTNFEFGPRETCLPGNNKISNCFFRNCRVGISSAI